MKKVKDVKKDVETVKLLIKELMPPGCHCNMEEKVKKKVDGVSEISINPMSNEMSVSFDSVRTSEQAIIDFMKKCGYECSVQKKPMEHEMKKGMKHEGHENHHAMMAQDFKKRTFVSLLFTVPVLILSPTIQKWLGIRELQFPGSDLLLFVLASVIVLYGALPFYKGALKSLKSKILDMNVLVALAVLSGYLYSVGATFFFTAADFYWEISTLVLFLAFGHWMEMRAVIGASGALNELVKLIPPKAHLVEGKDIVEVETASLKVGDIILVRPGDKIPIDGVVISGETSVNEAMISGESKPVSKKKGDKVIGGSVNESGSIKFRVEKTGEDTALAQIINLVKTAQESKPKTQKLADRAAHYLTLTAIIVGVGTFIFWGGIMGAGMLFALTLAITVVVIACPHALGLAIPTVTSISTTLAAKNGMLVKDMKAMEVAKNLDTIIFDKTGTLTKGEFGVTDVITLGDWKEDELLRRSAALEVNSEHVIARGIVTGSKQKNLSLPVIRGFKAIPGKGAKATVKGVQVHIGNKSLMKSLKVDIRKAQKRVDELSSQGKTVIFVGAKNKLQGIIALADIIRDESKEAVKALNAIGLEVAMLTGDNEITAGYVAKELGLDTYFAEVQPGDKSGKVKQLQAQGKRVAMVGDGINDAPALTQADVGIAIGAGTDVAIESAEIVLIKNDPREVAKLIGLSKATMTKMKQNLWWATGYNAVAIPVAAGVLRPWNIILKPEWAALIMAASSIIVVANALMLRRMKL